jgi:SNF1-activating kinase 1
VKIADFGISHFSHAQFLAAQGKTRDDLNVHDKILMDESDLNKFAGTPNFLAPEIVSDAVVDLSHSGTTSSLHTAESVRPEVRKVPITKAIDIWAFGVTLYAFLFGKLPFVADGEFAIYQKIREEDWNVPETMGLDKIPTGGRHQKRPKSGQETEGFLLVDLMKGVLEKDPLKRLTLQEVKVYS